MIQIPLSIRFKINESIKKTKTKEIKSAVYNEILYICLCSTKLLQLIKVPLLGQMDEDFISLEIDINEIAINEDGIIVSSAKSILLFDFSLNLLRKIVSPITNSSVRLFEKTIVLNKGNEIYHLLNDKFMRLRITPYFSRVIQTHVYKEIVAYNTYNCITAYDITTSRKRNQMTYEKLKSIFYYDSYFILAKQSEVEVYNLVSFDLVIRIDINMNPKIKWSNGIFLNEFGAIFLSGVDDERRYVVYIDGYIFVTNELVTNFDVFRKCFIGISKTEIIFLPNDPNFELDFVLGEDEFLTYLEGMSFQEMGVTKPINNEGEGSIVYETSPSKLPRDKNSSVNKIKKFNNLIDSLGEYKNETRVFVDPYISGSKFTRMFEIEEYLGDAKVGYFLSYIINHGVRLEIKKLIINAMKEKDLKRIRILSMFLKFGPKVFVVWREYSFNVNCIYECLTSLVPIEYIDANLLWKMLQICFVEGDLNMMKYFSSYDFTHTNVLAPNGFSLYNEYLILSLENGLISRENSMILDDLSVISEPICHLLVKNRDINGVIAMYKAGKYQQDIEYIKGCDYCSESSKYILSKSPEVECDVQLLVATKEMLIKYKYSIRDDLKTEAIKLMIYVYNSSTSCNIKILMNFVISIEDGNKLSELRRLNKNYLNILEDVLYKDVVVNYSAGMNDNEYSIGNVLDYSNIMVLQWTEDQIVGLIKLFEEIKRPRVCFILRHLLYIRTGKPELLYNISKMIGDDVFSYNGSFIGRESFMSAPKEEIIYSEKIKMNSRELNLMKPSCVWTDVKKAKIFKSEFSEYLEKLKDLEKNFGLKN